MIELINVTKTFPGSDSPAVDNLSIEIKNGEIVVLVGPSGCGKTTTLKMINRLIEPTSGTITISGEPVDTVPAHQLRRRIGYVIQQVGLFPHKTVGENITTVPELLDWSKEDITARLNQLADAVQLDPGFLDRYPARNCPADSSNGLAWPGRSPPIRPFSSWMSRSPPSIRSSGPTCRTSYSTCRTASTRRSSS